MCLCVRWNLKLEIPSHNQTICVERSIARARSIALAHTISISKHTKVYRERYARVRIHTRTIGKCTKWKWWKFVRRHQQQQRWWWWLWLCVYKCFEYVSSNFFFRCSCAIFYNRTQWSHFCIRKKLMQKIQLAKGTICVNVNSVTFHRWRSWGWWWHASNVYIWQKAWRKINLQENGHLEWRWRRHIHTHTHTYNVKSFYVCMYVVCGGG